MLSPEDRAVVTASRGSQYAAEADRNQFAAMKAMPFKSWTDCYVTCLAPVADHRTCSAQ